MRRNILCTLLIAGFVVSPSVATAEVLAAGRTGFSLKIETLSQASPARAYKAFSAVERWWDMTHSYGGDAEKLSIELAPGGSMLESLPNGGFIEHMQVVYANPGKELRLLGGLGPLQPMGVYGAMNIQFEAFGTGSKTVLTYNVSGFSAQGLVELAPIVDRVLAGQMQRHASYADVLKQQADSGS
ncbi:MAG: hypothetical protein AAGI24_03995 [Pseudomonadota bacterium]